MTDDYERLRALLCKLEIAIRDSVIGAREKFSNEDLSQISEQTEADTIYAIDKISEVAIREWFAAHWPDDLPVKIVMEGLEGQDAPVFPVGSRPEWCCLIDPIDGTRNIMYDKRSAWALAGIAPLDDGDPQLRDVVAAAMTELPTSRQWASDQISAVQGCGKNGLQAERHDVIRGGSTALKMNPSSAHDLKHGFASIVKFFPEGKVALAQIEEKLFDELYGLGSSASPLVFDDQYITTGGQLYEILIGHDRMIADFRGHILPKIGYPEALCCHPYDIVTELIAREAGCIIEDPLGQPLDGPMDTTTSINWVCYANPTIAETVRPILTRLIQEVTHA
jgi:fructose-1,6-bisphosphatase/inositol monophosphatase family enzyme